MNWVKKFSILLSLSLTICTFTFAQGDLRKAKKYIELQDFDAAIMSLNDVIAHSPNNQDALIALADAYRLSNKLPMAHSTYSKALELGEMPTLANKSYGDVLMTMQDYQGALKQYSLYGAEYFEQSQALIEKCGYAISHADDAPRFSISEEYINTSKRDFGPAFFREDLVYLSNRTDLDKPTYNSHVNIELLKVSKDGKGVLKYPKRIKSLTGLEFNIISIAYNPAQQMVAVTKGGQYDNINLAAKDKCTLYIGRFDANGSIQDLKPYEFNQTDYSTGFASFSDDGMTMYFASDRSEGMGGFDIYQSKIIGGEWSAPMNLGTEVNTIGNEITPARVGDMLTFASDNRPGYGGYDVFAVFESTSGFVNAENLGTGINSPFDEYGMIYDAVANVGYISSTRSKGKGLEDIYRVVSREEIVPSGKKTPLAATAPAKLTPKDYEILKGMAVDIETGMAISNVEVFASTDKDATIITSKTNNKGLFSMPLIAGKYYNIKFKGDKYFTSSRTIKMEESRRMPLMKIAMEGQQQIVAQTDQPMIRPVALGVPKARSTKTNTTSSRTAITSPASKIRTETTFKIPTVEKAYAIQIAAISKNERSSRFANIKDLGSLYTLFDNRVYKVRCGLFASRSEAEEILRRIKVRGYESAFIVEEKPSDSTDLVMMDFKTYERTVPRRTSTITATSTSRPVTTSVVSSTSTTPSAISTYVAPSRYKVRLATYSNPKWFDHKKVQGPGLGYVEIIKKEELSIYVLAGFNSLSEAKIAHQKAINNGFKDAHVVKDENGVLSKVK